MHSGDNHPSVATLPDNFELAVSLTREELAEQVRLMAALKMFELGKLSSGKAAELAGLSRVAFFDACGRYRVSLFNYGPGELERELKTEIDGQLVAEKA
jgi:predicted HTH domain antitoxin